MKQNTICRFAYQCAFAILLYCCPAVFTGLLKNDLRILRQELSTINRVHFIPLSESYIKLWTQHLFTHEKFVHCVLWDPTHPRNDNLSKHGSRSSTRSIFRTTSSRNSINGNSTVPYTVCILANGDRFSTEFLSVLSQMFKSFIGQVPPTSVFFFFFFFTVAVFPWLFLSGLRYMYIQKST